MIASAANAAAHASHARSATTRMNSGCSPSGRLCQAALATATPDRLLVAAQALREGFTVAEVHAIAKYDPWFLERIAEIVQAESQVMADGLPIMTSIVPGWTLAHPLEVMA